MADHIGRDPEKAYYGEYSIDALEQVGNYTYAVVQYHPNEGTGNVYLLLLEKQAGKLSIVDKVEGDLPLSMGVQLYKATLLNETVVFGSILTRHPRKLNSQN